MTKALRRYEFSERLAEILGESRRDLRFRVTLMVTGGLVAPGPRGPGAPLATPQYAATLLIAAMAAPKQADTVEAVRCYQALFPTVMAADATAPRIVLGLPATRPATDKPRPPAFLGRGARFGDVLAQLLEYAKDADGRATLAHELFGIWVSRSFPVAAIQLAAWSQGRRTLVSQRYELAEGARPPAWLDPDRGGSADPGLFHSVFLPIGKLIEIGMLTALQDERKSPMINLGSRLANLAKLARQSRHRRPWEKFLATVASAQDFTEKADAQTSRLVEVTDFGSNPGNLRMLKYIPDGLPASAPLVVVLHGCIQTAASYDYNTGWSSLADRFGFALLLPEQNRANNPLRCFNWFRLEDTERDSGEALSIRQMIEQMIGDHELDHRSIYVTGLSAGGAMTSVMLATHPDLFAGGAIIAGVPYRAANGLQEAFDSIFQGRSRSASEWGDSVRAASPHQGPWPKVSVWHGAADATVQPLNAIEIIKQWTDVHGLPPVPTIEKTVNGHPHCIWQNESGDDLIESYTITGMAHGAPLDSGGEEGCGHAGLWFHDVGISSTYHIAGFWGLTERSEVWAAERQHARAEPTPDRAVDLTDDQASPPQEIMNLIIDGDTGAPAQDTEERKDAPAPGIDIQSILRKSFELAGLAANLGNRPAGSGTEGGGVGGVDIQSILSKSFELAGLAASLRDGAADSSAGDARSTESGWETGEWQRLVDDPRAPGDKPVLFGYASSGIKGDVGNKTRRLSRRITLGPRPMLSYIRRLDLSAAVNIATTAGFTVLVDDVVVDQVSVNGMNYVEADWTERKDIDLAQFAGRTVTLTFEVAASSNVCIEVFAKAWLSHITVVNTATAEVL